MLSRTRWTRKTKIAALVMLAVLLYYFFVIFVVSTGRVTGRSMLPTIAPQEQLLFVKYEGWLNKLGLRQFQPGDVVVLTSPEARNVTLALRVLAVGGDTVKVEKGRFYVNGEASPADAVVPYWQDLKCFDTTSPLAVNAHFESHQTEVVVPAGQYYVVMDNRSGAPFEDSRYFGSVPARLVHAKVISWGDGPQADADETTCQGV